MSQAAALPARSDRRRTLVTPEGIAMPVVLASRGTRFGALLIDLMIVFGTLFVVTVALVLIVMQFEKMSGGKLDLSDGQNGLAVQGLAIFYIAFAFLTRYGYFLFFELGPRGATPGKRMTGIRIAARGGGRLSAEMVLARNLLRDIEVFMPIAALLSAQGEGPTGWASAAWFLVFALFPFFNRDRLRAGDVIGGTWVIEAPKRKLEAVMSTGKAAASNTSAQTGASYRFGEAELAIYGEFELQTLERVLREDREEAIVAVHEAICRKIGWNPGAGDERAFLQAYYTQLRARLEAGMRLGKRKADKHGTGGG
jgi:uncharacterized RDD family membrane protein YckC